MFVGVRVEGYLRLHDETAAKCVSGLYWLSTAALRARPLSPPQHRVCGTRQLLCQLSNKPSHRHMHWDGFEPPYGNTSVHAPRLVRQLRQPCKWESSAKTGHIALKLGDCRVLGRKRYPSVEGSMVRVSCQGLAAGLRTLWTAVPKAEHKE